MLVLKLKSDDYVRIGTDVTVHVGKIKGRIVSIAIEAPREKKIMRSDILEKMTKEEQDAELEKATGK